VDKLKNDMMKKEKKEARTANSHLAKAGNFGNDTLGSSLEFLLLLIN